MGASDWFGVVEVTDGAAEEPFFLAVLALLDRVRPAEMDRAASRMEVTPSYVDFHIAHRSAAEASITMFCRNDGYGASQSIIEIAEEYYRVDGGDDPVPDQMLDELELLLTHVYTIERTTWRGRPVKTETRGPRPFEDPSTVSLVHLLSPFRSLLPKSWLVTTVREVSFRPQGTGR